MRQINQLNEENAVLLVVDMQEAFRNAIPDFAMIASRIAIAIRGFDVLELPVIVTEQYSAGLGSTVEELRLCLPESSPVIEKSTFSAYREASFLETLKLTGRTHVLICGIEAHVCVQQTAFDLKNEDYDVHLLSDCVSSRFDHDKSAGLARMHDLGVVSSSMEMALFELMSDSKHKKFKAVQSLLR